jgi:hypothetical protein
LGIPHGERLRNRSEVETVAQQRRRGGLVSRAFAAGVVLLSLGRLVHGRDVSDQADRSPVARPAPIHGFADGSARSADELVSRLLDALATRDEVALHRLRVTRDEYLNVIVPQTVEPGRPPRQVSERPKEFFWEVLDLKSRLYASRLLQDFGGRRYIHHDLRFSRPTRQYAGYDAYGEVRLALADEDGAERELRAGWIAAVGERFKFLGFNSDG